MKFFFSLILFAIILSCNNHSQESSKKIINNNLNKEESFSDFLNHFGKDSVFQNSRIEFPLLSMSEDDSGETEQNLIQQKDWGFSDLSKLQKPKYIQSIKNINKQEYHLIFQIEDTGVHVVYIFKKQKNKWMLTQITDNSD